MMNPLSVTDIVKKVGKFKKDMEKADDLKNIKSSEIYQDAIAFFWLGLCSVRLIYRCSKLDSQRLVMSRCFAHLHFDLFHKYKKIPFHSVCFYLSTYEQLAEDILEHPEIVKFMSSQPSKATVV